MKCRVCGAELKKDGELCNNCLNRLQQEEAIRGDKTPVYGFKSTFILGYELLRHCEQIGIIKRKTVNIFERHIFIESVKNVEEVFGKIKEVFK